MNATAEKTAPTLPPEERFWKRYSPHGEAPLSLAGSAGLHLLIAGGLILFGVYAAALFAKEAPSSPIIDVVAFPSGGGGAKPGAPGVGPGGEPQDEGLPFPALPQEEPMKRPPLSVPAKEELKGQFDENAIAVIEGTHEGEKFRALDQAIRDKLGPSGPPAGGGREGEEGPPKKGTPRPLKEREKRMLRWHMRFTAENGTDYLAQLKDLGAILMFPGDPDAEKQPVVRDLVKGAKLLKEDLRKIDRIYWIDDKEKSIRDVIAALGIRLDKTPPKFIAFMPKELETRLFEMEKSYVTNRLKEKFDEGKIEETTFKVVLVKGKYRPELVSVRMKD